MDRSRGAIVVDKPKLNLMSDLNKLILAIVRSERGQVKQKSTKSLIVTRIVWTPRLASRFPSEKSVRKYI